ncbi:bifunctional glycosyltransferase/CDP-glycerol:glycerophosphate glycerophosphotransferase [Actinacidiphila oryziradicis]|uniref:Glycosyltransferase n=1 Tax=Actinacidiphila oryziradicis TaxID=2571141 RepID=A0A4U0STZ3_9ACTN|nr:CDP-glycerol glycerophosphotransferase family protein [Actinacidiphila oryziradicis]TKA13506.1 glycosyltransferase [Actinacidiphila oryziradicis]
MPRFSVVVPAHKVQGFLRVCLESVLDQSYGDLELLAVDDCSPDASGAIIDELAARDARLRPLHLPRTGGPGPARNAGAAHADGDYLLFLDGDDLLAPGALAAIDARLRESGDPEVLLFGHERADIWERVSPRDDELSLSGPFAAFPAAWNRAVRRDFWQLLPGFGDGPYEDLPLAYDMLLAAAPGRVACLDRVCVIWRERRRGSFTTTPGRQHFAVLARYDEVFAALGPGPGAAAPSSSNAGRADAAGPGQTTGPGPGHASLVGTAHAVVYRAMADRLLEVLDDPRRIAPADRAEFFREAARSLRRHRPPGYAAPPGPEGVRLRTAVAGSYGAYRALELGAKAARTLGGRKNTAARKAYAQYYRTQLRRPVDENLVVYGAYWNRGVSCNPAAVYRKARELAPHLHGVWVVNRKDREAVPEGVDCVEVNSRRYWEVLARAKYLVNNANFTGEVIKRPEQVYLQTHHGTPLKHMGMDLRAHPAAGKSISFTRLLGHADQWDFSVSANQHSTEIWERVYPSDYETLPAGYPRNDAFFAATADDVRRLRAALGIQPGSIAILYAPTHRDYQRDFVPPLDLARLARELGPGHVILLRAHYFYGAARTAGLPEGVLDVSAHPSVEELCLASDALLTDYSSLMFDYANLDRPILVHAADWDTYRAARGVYFDLTAEPPGLVLEDEAGIAAAFRSGAWDAPAPTALRAAFRSRFCPYDDGRAAERIVRRVLLGEPGLLPVLPLPERTVAPSPRQVAPAGSPPPDHAVSVLPDAAE